MRENLLDNVKTVSQMHKSYIEDMKSYKPIDFGIPSITSAYNAFRSKEVLLIAARSGVGKTTLGLELGKNIAKNDNGYCPFFSLEMGEVSLYERMATMALSKSELSPFTTDRTIKALEDLRNINTINCEWEGFLTIDETGMTLERIRDYILAIKDMQKVSCVVIDYLGYIRDTKAGTNYEKVTRTAKGIKELAKLTDTRILLLVQTSRAGEDGSAPVKLHHLRDSGAVEESADYILGAWNGDNQIICEDLKNRKKQKGSKWALENLGLYLHEVELIEVNNAKTFG